jgi:hypothetical protein
MPWMLIHKPNNRAGVLIRKSICQARSIIVKGTITRDEHTNPIMDK